MEQLWAPWRSKYIQSFTKDNEISKSDCFFCDAANSDEIEKHLVVHKGNHVFVILNRYPYNTGHVMVTPLRHCHEFETLSKDESEELMLLLQVTTKVLNNVYKPDGINIGANLGESAGAGVPGHLHFHLLPRWRGDTNFLPVIAETKVISEPLNETWQKLHSEFINQLSSH